MGIDKTSLYMSIYLSRGENCVPNVMPSTNGVSLGRFLETKNKKD